MARSPDIKLRLMKAAARAVARYLRFVGRHATLVIEPADARERALPHTPFVFAMWHGQFLPLLLLNDGSQRAAVMVARHQDAEIMGEMVGTFGMEVVRGAGAGLRRRDRGGATALRSAIRVLETGATFAMTADIPPGPARRAGLGIVTLAKHSGRPVIPFAAATTRYLALPTWSKLTIPLPFGKLAYVVGEPVHVPKDASDASLESAREAVERELNRVTERAYALAGADMRRATPPQPIGPTSPEVPVSFGLKLYRTGTRVLSLGAPLLLSLRSRKGKEVPARLRERYGNASLPRPDGPLFWIHAASVGETNSILPLIERLRARRPDVAILLTTGTVTSAALAAERLPDGAMHQFVPLDVPASAARFLAHWRPDLAVFTESEIWPNLILALAEKRIPLALVNARMSARSATRWRRNTGISRPLFSRFTVVLAQNEGYQRTFSELGVRRALAVGNLKIDAPPPPIVAASLEDLERAAEGRRVFVAASTHPGEEDIVADAHRRLAEAVPGVLTIIAPRHPERGTQIADMLTQRGFKIAQRSTGALPGPDTEIYIADTIGELGTLYRIADVAFIGGSLVEHGGQNPIEAVRHGAAVITGPSLQNFHDVYRALSRRGGVAEVTTAEELASEAAAFMQDAAKLAAARAGAEAALSVLGGALDRTADVLAELLPSPQSPSPHAGAARAAP